MHGMTARRRAIALCAGVPLLLVVLGGCGPRLQLPMKMRVGQHFDAMITEENRSSYEGEAVSQEEASLPVRIEVVEKNDKGFVTVWHHGCLKSDGIDSEGAIVEQRIAGITTGLLFLEGLDLKLQTDELGRPWKLLNRFEIRSALVKRFETLEAELEAIVAAQSIDPMTAYHFAGILNLQSRLYVSGANLAVELELLKYAFLLTSFNGESLPLSGRESYTREHYSPFRPSAVATSGHVAVTELDEARQRAWVEWSTEVDPESHKRSLAFVWPRMAREPSTRPWAEPEEIPDFDVRSFGLLDLDLVTGLAREAKLESRTTVEKARYQTLTRIVQQPAKDRQVIPKGERSFSACRPKRQA